MFLAPAFLIYTVFLFLPLILTFWYSLTTWNGVSAKVFAGLANYRELASSSDYWLTFSNTVKLTVISLIVQIGAGILLA